MQQPNYVLENNRTPATHFIEVWKVCLGRFKHSPKPRDINQLDFQTDEFTVAIFKIHPKCN